MAFWTAGQDPEETKEKPFSLRLPRSVKDRLAQDQLAAKATRSEVILHHLTLVLDLQDALNRIGVEEALRSFAASRRLSVAEAVAEIVAGHFIDTGSEAQVKAASAAPGISAEREAQPGS